ncbi:MAG: site-specific integrase [Bacteroides sp.]|nr:site-specific integrase [Bacteroides sp.]
MINKAIGNVKFLLHKRNKDDGKAQVRMRITMPNQPRVDIPTGIIIRVEDWDARRQRLVPDARYAIRHNKTITEYELIVNEIFAECAQENRIMDVHDVRNRFNRKSGRNEERFFTEPLFPAFDDFVQTNAVQKQWTESTVKKFATLRKHLYDFDPYLSFDSLTEVQMQRFIDFMRYKGLRNTTVEKTVKLFRWFLRWAAHAKYYDGNIHDTFKPKLKGVGWNSKEIIYLTKDELQRLETFQFPQEYLGRVRDVFVFCCFTGLRYSDVAKLKRSDIKDGFIEVVTAKTNDCLRIELNGHSQAILDRYADKVLPNDMALPVISNVKMNADLKLVGQLCGFNEPIRVVYFRGSERCEEVLPKWKLLTTHCGRRTFVITALQLGIPVEVIMKWTGHADFASMKPYVKIVDDLKAQSMLRFNDL